MLTTIDLRSAILHEIGEIRGSGVLAFDEIQDDARLTADLGLDSLALARMYIALEDRFGVDPFTDKFDIVDMRTLGDLLRAFKETLAAQPVEA
jgi:acyl carrier protein